MTVIPDALVDKSVTWNQNFKQYQFERNGYFAVDPDSTPSKVRNSFRYRMSVKSTRKKFIDENCVTKKHLPDMKSSLGLECLVFGRFIWCVELKLCLIIETIN